MISSRHDAGICVYDADMSEYPFGFQATPSILLQVAGQVAECLARLHEQGLAHRNVTFDTIVFKNNAWTLAGFENAAPRCQWVPVPERFSYTMDPEQIFDFRSKEVVEVARAAPDVWALGCVMRECLVKKQLFRGRHRNFNRVRLCCLSI